ncbi:MAG: hypothetical protein ACK4PR_05425 [Gammaproteobacteria bacterium]
MYTLFELSESEKRVRQEEYMKITRVIYESIQEACDEFCKTKREAGYNNEEIEKAFKEFETEMFIKARELYFDMLRKAAREQEEKNNEIVESNLSNR